MRILGIDTSCDDTCVSVIKSEIRNPTTAHFQWAGSPSLYSGAVAKSETEEIKFEILSNVVSSQVKLHAKYGGVYPFLAKREHQRNLSIVFKKATWKKDFDLIGVTVGPGLEPCLWQGINFAKELAEKLKKPLIPVNHIEAHILANFIDLSEVKVGFAETSSHLTPRLRSVDKDKSKGANFIDRENSKLFPAVCLVVSGGHTQLILMRDIGKYKLIGETRDDAAGECFDKAARILGLGYPGGPAIAREAESYTGQTCVSLPKPMIYQKNYDFSFSGLKTAVLYDFRKRSPKMRKSKIYIQEMCKKVQQTIIDVLIHKTLRAARNFKVKSVILGGGVAANDELRKQFSHRSSVISHKLKFLIPPKIFCTDNAAMVAATAYFHQKITAKDLEKIKANANLRI